MKRILLIGSNGQVGQELQFTLTSVGEIIGVAREQLDLSQPDNIAKIIQDTHPNVIVNAAAYTAVDKAESETDLAYAVNEKAPKILAQESQKLGANLIHISTDYVFDGIRGIPLTEEDKTNPIGAYGASKLAGEQAIQENCQRYIILRTAWVYGTYGKSNFVKTMLRLGAEREQLRVVGDQVGSPTWAKDIADAITQLIQLDQKADTGIYHFTNSGVASWYDFAKAIFEEAESIGYPLKIKEVVPITTPEYPTPAKRPAYSVLSSQKLRTLLGTYPPHWRDSLSQMLFQLYSKNS